MKNNDKLIIFGILILIVVLVFVSHRYNVEKKEHFKDLTFETNVVTNPEFDLREQAEISSGEEAGVEDYNSSSQNEDNIFSDDSSDVDLDSFVRKTDIERAARASAREYCPVSPDYNPSDFVKKTEIDLQKQCPKMPDLKDYVLKTTIPPVQKCPSCVCPKVKVTAGMCKKCPEPKNNCPKPQPCGIEQCKDVIKCAPGNKPFACPKCPSPEPCPKEPKKVCPSFEIPESNFKCPSPKPCPAPQPCPGGDGRCPEPPETKCKYYGVKDIIKEKPTNDIVEELLSSEDPKLRELLTQLRERLGFRETTQALEQNKLQQTLNNYLNSREEDSLLVTTQTQMPIPTTMPPMPTTMPPMPTTMPPMPTTMPPMPTTQPPRVTTQPPRVTASTTMSSENLDVEKYNLPTIQNTNTLPRGVRNNNTNYGLNNYMYSIMNGTPTGPSPTINTELESTTLNSGIDVRACDVNDTSCSYNTNLNL